MPPAGTPGAPAEALPRVIGRFDLTAAVINAVIGSAIFGLPARQAALVGQWSPLACLAAGAGVLLIVLCFAEVASRFEEAGGPYVYARESFGPAVGFQVGWLTFWIRVTAVSANLNVFVAYLGELQPWARAGLGRAAVMGAVMTLAVALNLSGTRQATWAVNAFSLAKLVPLALLVVLGLGRVDAATLASQQVAVPQWTQAVLLLMFAYGGFEAPLIPAGEARRPQRDTAFALVVALALIAIVYTLVQLVVVGTVPRAAAARAPLAQAFAVLLGPGGIALAAVTAMLSIYGYTLGTTLQSPRVLFAMAQRGELPALLGRVHPGWRTPGVAILTYALLALALALRGDFESNATLSAIVRLVTYGLTCVALIVLRRRRPQQVPGFRVPGGPLVAVAGTGFCLFLLSTRSFAQIWALGLLMALGAVLWLLAAVRRAA